MGAGVCVCVCARVCACMPYLDPGIHGTELLDKLRPLVNHLDDLVLLHQRQRDVGPGVETHDLTGRQQGAPRQLCLQ